MSDKHECNDPTCPICSGDASMGDVIARAHSLVEKGGWGVMGVLPDPDADAEWARLGFAYTYGAAANLGHPEIVVVCGAVDVRTLTGVVNEVLGRVSTGELRLPWDSQSDVDGVIRNYTTRFAPVAADWVGENMTFAFRTQPGEEITALQLIYPDPHGRFPDDEEYDMGDYPQTLLGVPA